LKVTKWFKPIGIVTVMSISLIGCQSEGKVYSPEQVIQNSVADTKKIPAYYAEAVITSNDGLGDVEMKEWFSEDGKKRVETLMPKTGEKSISVNDGEKLTTFDESANTAFIIDIKGETLPAQMSPKEQAEMLLDSIKDTHTISLIGEEKLLDRDVYHLKAVAKEKGSLYGDQEIWVDKENWFVLKSHSESGEYQVSIEYKKIDFDPTFNDSIFKLDLPKDVKIEDLKETIEEKEVNTLDEAVAIMNKPFLYVNEQDGLTIENMSVLSLGEELDSELTINYLKDNLPYFSLNVFANNEENEPFTNEGENIRGFKGEKTDEQGFRTLSWAEDGIGYSIILTNPDLSFEEMKDIISGMDYVKQN
jgi:outer membrane lipoprotein-sorting protein